MDIIVDISDRICEVRDQGERDTCLVFAATVAHEILHRLSSSLCVEWLYFYAIKVAWLNLGDGTNIVGVSSALKQYGQPIEEVWRYEDISDFENRIPPRDPKPIYFADGIYEKFATRKLLDSLDQKHPVVVTLTTDIAFQYPQKFDGYAIVEHETSNAKDVFHAVLVVGYGIIEKRTYFKVANSWGEDWGVQGFAWLSEQFLNVNAYAMLWLQNLK